MTQQVTYSYVTLRYVHDMTTQEFVNVGVVVFSPEVQFVGARVLTASHRVKAMFPDVSHSHLANLLSRVQAQVEILRTNIASNPKAKSASQIESLVTSVLPRDESSLQWSSVGGGLCSEPRAALEALFKRMVTKYERERTVQQVVIKVEEWTEFKPQPALFSYPPLLERARLVALPHHMSFAHGIRVSRKAYGSAKPPRRNENGDAVSV